MKIRLIFFIIFLGLCGSCNYFDTQRIYSGTFLEEQLRDITWNDVDTYPTFKDCESYIEKAAQKKCFQNQLLKHFEEAITANKMVSTQNMEDTLTVQLQIDKEGLISWIEVNGEKSHSKEINSIIEILKEAITTLPKTAPAYKRGIPVTVQFEVPITLKSKKL